MDFTAGEKAALFQTIEEMGVPIYEADYEKYLQINRGMGAIWNGRAGQQNRALRSTRQAVSKEHTIGILRAIIASVTMGKR